MSSINIKVVNKGVERDIIADSRDSLRDILTTNGYPTSGVSITLDGQRVMEQSLDMTCPATNGSVITITAPKQASGLL